MRSEDATHQDQDGVGSGESQNEKQEREHIPIMPGEHDPPRKAYRGPRYRHWYASVRPHWIEIATALLLVAVGGAQVAIYLRQAGIMDTQANIAQKQLEISAAEGRAWVGPTQSFFAKQLERDKAIAIQIQYANTGREPATYMSVSGDPKTFSLADWANGDQFSLISSPDHKTAQVLRFAAGRYVLGQQTVCMETDIQGGGQRVAFPSTGNSVYILNIDTSAPPSTIVASEKLIDGDEVLVVTGCFAYTSARKYRHTAFCYFYDAKHTTTPQALNICPFGNAAD